MNKQQEALKLAHDYLLSKQMGAHIIIAIREALAEQPAQQQEPVAKVVTDNSRELVVESLTSKYLRKGTKLYTSPPASKPLTDEQIKVGWRTLPIQAPMSWSAYLAGARMAEAAHGIKGDA